MPLTFVRSDITKMRVDAIVNAANVQLVMGGGVCGAIFKAAGEDELQAACDKLAPIEVSDAVITPGFGLPVKHIIHAAGPMYRGGKYGEEEQLRSCYTNALNLAQKNNCESVAFPIISSGVYGYPKDEAIAAATGAIGQWLLKDDASENGMDVYLVVFDKTAFTLSQKLLGNVETCIDEIYADRRIKACSRRRLLHAEEEAFNDGAASLDEPFTAALLRLIDAKGESRTDVYKRANLDSKLFYKVTHNKDYKPKKKTVIAFAVALRLTLGETSGLLKCAGFALSRSIMFDVIVEFFITNGIYDIYEINNTLYKYGQPILGGEAREDREQSAWRFCKNRLEPPQF